MHENFRKISKQIDVLSEALWPKIKTGLGTAAATAMIGNATAEKNRNASFSQRNVPANYSSPDVEDKRNVKFDIGQEQFKRNEILSQIKDHFKNLQVENERLKHDPEGYIFAFNKKTMKTLGIFVANGQIDRYLELWNYLKENPDEGRIDYEFPEYTPGIENQTSNEFYAQENKVKVKLQKNKILQIIQEEIDLFVKQKQHDEKYGKLLDEFSSVFLEALEINDLRLKKTVRNSLSVITENWGDTGFGLQTAPHNNGQNEEELAELKREIMLHLTGLNKQQLQTILTHVKSQGPMK